MTMPDALDGKGNLDVTSVESVTAGTTAGLTAATATTAVLAALEEHTVRHRGATIMALLVAIVTFASIHLTTRRAPGYLAAALGIGATIVTCIVLLVIDRRRGRITERQFLVLGFVGVSSILAMTFYTGVFSPAFMTAYVGLYYFGLGDSTIGSWLMYAYAAMGYAALAAVVALGVVPPDESLLPLASAHPPTLFAVAVALEGILALTFWLARYSRRATLRAMERLERAQRNLRQREALLHEARADIARMFEVGKQGRFTGQRIGRYTLDEIIGRGGMGEVYRAVDDSSELAAVKVLHPHLIEDVHAERFFREARAASAVASPHIVGVRESGTTEDGLAFIAMELLEGADLGWYLRENRRLSLEATLDLVSQVAAGLGAAQDADIVHRDLKPQNLFHARDAAKNQVWKILDFGVSKVGEGTSTLTQGGIVGTPSYMSPEQTRGEAVDHRTDVFALGAIAYRALTGRPAFTGPDSMSTMYNVGHVQPARPSDYANVGDDVDRVLALALAKERGHRFDSATTFAASLRDATRSRTDGRLRADADALLEREPWGADLLQRPRKA